MKTKSRLEDPCGKAETWRVRRVKLLKCFMQRKSILTTLQGTDLGRFGNRKRPAQLPCSEEVVVQPEVRMGKGKSRSHRQRDGFSFYLGETDIPEIIVEDKVLKLAHDFKGSSRWFKLRHTSVFLCQVKLWDTVFLLFFWGLKPEMHNWNAVWKHVWEHTAWFLCCK